MLLDRDSLHRYSQPLDGHGLADGLTSDVGLIGELYTNSNTLLMETKTLPRCIVLSHQTLAVNIEFTVAGSILDHFEILKNIAEKISPVAREVFIFPLT